MKLTHSTTLFPIVIMSILFIAVSCHKKSTDNNTDPTPTTSTSVNSVKQSDQSGSSAADGALDDVNDFINNNINPQTSARVEAYNLPCGVIRVDTTTKNAAGNKIYQMQYGSQTPCGYKLKSGTVTFELIKGTAFVDTGAEYKIIYTDYVVEVLATNDIIKINGFLIVTNVNGGPIWKAVTTSDIIKHRIRGTYSITYANGVTRERTYYQTRTWNSNSGWPGLTFNVDGDTTINSIKVSETGQTYEGNNDFKTQILTIFSWANCGTDYTGPFVLKTGQARMNVAIPSISAAYFGVEAGYYVKTNSTPTKVNDCTSNAYKITIMVDTTTTTQYQLY